MMASHLSRCRLGEEVTDRIPERVPTRGGLYKVEHAGTISRACGERIAERGRARGDCRSIGELDFELGHVNIRHTRIDGGLELDRGIVVELLSALELFLADDTSRIEHVLTRATAHTHLCLVVAGGVNRLARQA